MIDDNSDLLINTQHDDSFSLDEDETILWQGKSNLTVFLIRRILVLIPLAVILAIMETYIILAIFNSGPMYTYIYVFLAIFLSIPVLFFLRYIFKFVIKKYKVRKRTEFLITNKRIIINKTKAINSLDIIERAKVCSIITSVTPFQKLLGLCHIYFHVEGEMYFFEDIPYSGEVKLKLDKIIAEIKDANGLSDKKTTQTYAGGNFDKINDKKRFDFMLKVDDDFGEDNSDKRDSSD